MPDYPAAILDSDTLSALLKQNSTVIQHVDQYLKTHGKLSFSIISKYEIMRGLYARNAIKQLKYFEDLCHASHIFPLNTDIVKTAAQIYGDMQTKGAIIQDADILIGATALTHNMSIVTNNINHFSRIENLKVINWLNP